MAVFETSPRFWHLVLLLGALGLLWSPSAQAEPRFALRDGAQCSLCHVNQTGGGMRTPYGVAFSQADMTTWQMPGVFVPTVGESVSVGANVRLENQTRLPTQTELGENTWDLEAGNSFEMPELNLYLRLEAAPERLSIYLDETVGPEGASAREAFVLLQSDRGFYAKGGRFMLPFGMRQPDDESFVRAATGFTYANQDLGLEVGYLRGPLSAQLALTNGSGGGSDPDLYKQLTGSVTAVVPRGRAGASVAWNDTSDEDFTYRTWTSGIHAGTRLGRFYGMFELDWIHGVSGEDTFDQVPFYLELDFEAYKGLYVRFLFEAFDPLLQMAENERDRFVVGLSWFPVQMLELRAEYRINRDITQRADGNVDEFLFQLHGFL